MSAVAVGGGCGLLQLGVAVGPGLAMFTITLGQYAISIQQESLPAIYNDYKRHAKLVEEFALRPHEGELCFVSVSTAGHWPFLTVAQRFELSEGGFDPGALIVPEAKTLFLGAGRRLLGYRLELVERLWEDVTDAGFWEWSIHGDVVLMSGELELAAWAASGQKLWSMPVQHNWEYHVDRDQVHVNVLGRKTVFGLRQGPQAAAREA